MHKKRQPENPLHHSGDMAQNGFPAPAVLGGRGLPRRGRAALARHPKRGLCQSEGGGGGVEREASRDPGRQGQAALDPEPARQLGRVQFPAGRHGV